MGADGPILLQGHYLIEQMANSNRERIPERQPHAKGSGAFGHLEVTRDVSDYTKASVFQPGTKTDTFIRFSTVAGERYPEVATWNASGDFIRAAYTLRKDDDDRGQPCTLVRQVMDDAQRDRLVSNVVGHLKKGVTEPVLECAFQY